MNYLNRKKFFFIFLLCFPAIIQIKGQVQPYNEQELSQLKEFLLQPCNLELPSNQDNGFTRNFHTMAKSKFVSEEDLDDVTKLVSLLEGVTFTNGRITEINWGGGGGIGGFAGKLDLSACSELKKFEFRMSDNNRIPSIILNATNLYHVDVMSPTGATSILEELILTDIEKGNYLSYSSENVPYLNCYGNKLTFNRMPKIIVEHEITAGNYYFAANQQDSVNTKGNYTGEIIDLHTDYFFDDVTGIMWTNDVYDFGPTKYVWKDEEENELIENTDYTTDGNGYFTFTNSSLNGKTVVCEMSHNLFQVNKLYEQEPGMYGSSGNSNGEYNNLILKYQTTLYKDPTVGINKKEVGVAIYFTEGMLIVEKDIEAFVSIYHISGTQIFSTTEGKDKTIINTENWQPGIYLVKVSTREGNITKKIRKK
ncbi:MAG: T9SS type A sorting domain-containing protein [Candidatus Azobacteroides sp.]|nr:T9SS type A sorting domain-containing protein [Candidatus Azobacteroides sp.]